MDQLIADLEAATEGSRELDAAIAVVLHPRFSTYRDDPERGAGHRISDRDGPVYALDYTTSFDAAQTFVPDGCGWSMNDDGEGFVFEKIEREGGPGWLIIGVCDGDTTPALALCIAALRARQAMEVAA